MGEARVRYLTIKLWLDYLTIKKPFSSGKKKQNKTYTLATQVREPSISGCSPSVCMVGGELFPCIVPWIGRRKGLISKNREALKALQDSNTILGHISSSLTHKAMNSFCQAFATLPLLISTQKSKDSFTGVGFIIENTLSHSELSVTCGLFLFVFLK